MNSIGELETSVREGLRSVFLAGVAAADPRKVLPAALPSKPEGRCIVVGAGKAAAVMAAALEDAWPDLDLTGVVVTRYGHAVPTSKITVVEASHPVPDANGMAAAQQILAAVQGLGPADLVIALISGGGSALLTLPVEGLTLADKQAIHRGLLASGAPIDEMNAVRKALSRIKGGRLAQAAAPARVVTLLISDVPGDDPGVIASGPTVPSTTTAADALRILDHYRIDVPRHVRDHLAAEGAAMPHFDTDVRMIASPSMALEACARRAAALGWTPMILGDALEGESAGLGVVMAGIARSVRTHGHPVRPPALLLSGGETTVTIGSGTAGRGGRNTEFLLSLAHHLHGAEGIFALAGDSDGIDGTDDAAGATVTPSTLLRAGAAGLDARGSLRAHNSYTFFAALGDLLVTGPTLTNVNDLRAVLVL